MTAVGGAVDILPGAEKTNRMVLQCKSQKFSRSDNAFCYIQFAHVHLDALLFPGISAFAEACDIDLNPPLLKCTLHRYSAVG